jgi:hypothetical protein
MATLTKEQIAMKKRQLIQLQEELKAVGAWPLEDDDLINVSGGIRNPFQEGDDTWGQEMQ